MADCWLKEQRDTVHNILSMPDGEDRSALWWTASDVAEFLAVIDAQAAEIERLRAENAAQDKQLCEMAQHCDDLSYDNPRLRARLTITGEKIHLCCQAWRQIAKQRSNGGIDGEPLLDCGEMARAALLAAGMEEKP